MVSRIKTIKCKRCGREISTMVSPIHSSISTMNKYQGICSNCMTEEEKFNMMLDMNKDVKEINHYDYKRFNQ